MSQFIFLRKFIKMNKALFLPSVFIPLRHFWMHGGNLSSFTFPFIVILFLIILTSSFFLLNESNDWIIRLDASFSSDLSSSRNFILVSTFSNLAELNLKFFNLFNFIGMLTNPLFSFNEYGALYMCLLETNISSI